VRLIVEKLARRCGFDAVEAAMPESDTKLLTHIRKERAHKAAKKAGAAATEVNRRAARCC
jgi:ribosomal RNA-processing protein 12